MKYLLELSFILLLTYNGVQGSNELAYGRAGRDFSSLINVLLGRTCFCKCGVPNFTIAEFRALDGATSPENNANAVTKSLVNSDPADIADAYFYTKFNESLQAARGKFNETDDEETFSIDEDSYFADFGDEEKFLGGDTLKENGFPWAVLVLIRGEPLAGGAIITDRHIITAASPLQGLGAADVKITAGLHDRCRPETTAWNISVSAIRTHPLYDTTDLRHDLAILTLSAKIAFNKYVSPICLPETVYSDTKQVAWISSWLAATILSGVTGTTIRPSCLPKIIRLPTLSNEECLRSEAPRGLWTHDKTCFGPFDGLNQICSGDVGSPVQIINKKGRFELTGILIIANSCLSDEPAMYIRIDKHMGWIKSVTTSGCTCQNR